jgi:hypothetical protein
MRSALVVLGWVRPPDRTRWPAVTADDERDGQSGDDAPTADASANPAS